MMSTAFWLSAGALLAASSAHALQSAVGADWQLSVGAGAFEYSFWRNTTTNVTVRFNEHTDLCEKTAGVRSYAGWIDLEDRSHTWFWFFESRSDPAKDPITLWVNGGPGVDSMAGLFQGVGPCNITADLRTLPNLYSWNEQSNLLFLSIPVGVGFSYASPPNTSLEAENATATSSDDTSPETNATAPISTSLELAEASWHILQTFFKGFSRIDMQVRSTTLNLFTEGYGGHFGPAMFSHYSKQNDRIKAGEETGRIFNLNALGIINGWIDAKIQLPTETTYLASNSYRPAILNETKLEAINSSLHEQGGCLELIDACLDAYHANGEGMKVCQQANSVCNNARPSRLVRDRPDIDLFDIRATSAGVSVRNSFALYLNNTVIKAILGVGMNYSWINPEVQASFESTPDWLLDDFTSQLGDLINEGVNVALIYGDADLDCNWLGGEAVSIEVDWSDRKAFESTRYQGFMVDGHKYGETRQHGKLSFTRVYDAGHMGPYYQPEAFREWFRRTSGGIDIASGNQ